MRNAEGTASAFRIPHSVPMDIVLFGKPGAGKGTQAPLLAAALEVPTVATGDVLRQAVREGTPLGREAKAAMDRGDLVPDPVILGIMKETLAKPEFRRGALFLTLIFVLPIAIADAFAIPFVFGGTSLLIVVGVALDTMKQLEAQLMMRNYEGFLK